MLHDFFAKKTNKVDILLQTNSKYFSENIDEFLHKTKYPSWMNNIKKISEHEKLDNNINRVPSAVGSIKQCPAFIDIIKNSLSICSPADFTMEFEKDTKNWKYYSPWHKFNVSWHDLYNQMGPNNPIIKNGVHFKIQTPFLLKSSKPVTLYFMQPLYHEFLPFIVMPGGINLNSKYPLHLNLNFVISNSEIENCEFNTKIIKIKKGDVLAYLHYGNKCSINDIKVNLMDPNEEFYPERLCEIGNYEKLSRCN